MKSKTILITDFSDELFIYAFQTMLHEEHGIVAIDNLEIFLNKVTNDGMDLFPVSKQMKTMKLLVLQSRNQSNYQTIILKRATAISKFCG